MSFSNFLFSAGTPGPEGEGQSEGFSFFGSDKKDGFGNIFGSEGMGGWFKSTPGNTENKGKKERDEKEKADREANHFSDVMRILRDVTFYSVKELKQKIILYSEENKIDQNFFLEKEEMRKTLINMMLSSLEPEDLIALNKEFHENNGETVKNFDREKLVEMILRPPELN